MISLGIDLAGKDKNPTGFAHMKDNEFFISKVYSDSEIISKTKELGPDVIAIDAPFSFPKQGFFRQCDLDLRKMGFYTLSPRLKHMEILVLRCQKILDGLKDLKCKIIEVFPRATEKILGIDKKFVRMKFGKISKDEYDAILCAITGKLYMEGKCREIGDMDKIVIP